MSKENKNINEAENSALNIADVRQRAIYWWNTLSEEVQIDLQYQYKSPCGHPLNAIGLTGREIEEIYRGEHVA